MAALDQVDDDVAAELRATLLAQCHHLLSTEDPGVPEGAAIIFWWEWLVWLHGIRIAAEAVQLPKFEFGSQLLCCRTAFDLLAHILSIDVQNHCISS